MIQIVELEVAFRFGLIFSASQEFGERQAMIVVAIQTCELSSDEPRRVGGRGVLCRGNVCWRGEDQPDDQKVLEIHEGSFARGSQKSLTCRLELSESMLKR